MEAAADEISAAADSLRRELQGKTGVQQASLENQLSAELPLLASKRSTATELTRRAVHAPPDSTSPHNTDELSC